jgi:hypothetical protein
MTQTASLIEICPKIAQTMLSVNLANRPISTRHIATLSRAMIEGDWKINGDMIRISKTGKVIDGQHRLHAVILSQTTIRSWVMVGLDDDVFDTIDIGKKRSIADTLSCRGEKNATSLGASLRLLDKYYKGTVEAGASYSTTDIEKVLEAHPNMRDCIFESKVLRGLAFPSTLSVCNYLFSKKNKTLADVFFQQLTTGTGLERGMPVHTLRERLVANAGSKSKLKEAYLFGLFIVAFNHFCNGKRLICLKIEEKNGKMLHFPKVMD